jgi:sugar lactone lactonase YvrE
VVDPEPVLPAAAELGEGPVWDDRDGTLLWVDILGHEVHRFDPATGFDRSHRLVAPVGAVAPRRDEGLVVAVGMGFAFLDERDGALSHLGSVAHGSRMNDGKCDPVGRFLAGTLSGDGVQGGSALYTLSADCGVRELLGGVTVSNGLAWSADGETLYYVDTPLERVDAFDYDATDGTLAERRTVVDLRDAPGRPDGLTIDTEGRLWIAMARGGQVRCHRPGGRLEQVLTLPAPVVTSCAFGGPGWRDLYITTGRWSGTDDQLAAQPAAGAVFCLRDSGATGLPAHRFAG